MDDKFLNSSVEITLFYGCDDSIPERLVDAIPWLQKFLDQAPEEYRDQVTIEISVDDYSAGIDISYQRPPTDAEKQDRLTNEQQRIDQRVAERRQQYERLKTEFGE